MTPSDTLRDNFIYGKDKLVEGIAPEERVDISYRARAHRKEVE